MISFDSATDPAFQKARHQNNLYVAMESMRSLDGGKESEQLQRLQRIIRQIHLSKKSKPTLLQQIQDALAVEHVYMTSEQIEQFFISHGKPDQINIALVSETPNDLDRAWGKLLLAVMQDAVEQYLMLKQKEGATKTAYNDLKTRLEKLDDGKKSRNDLWVAFQKTGQVEQGDTMDDYCANFAKKAGFNEEKIRRHRSYLDTEFYLLSTNNWWDQKDAATGGYVVVHSDFRNRVLGSNPKLSPRCLIRTTAEPPRGMLNFQPKKPNTTRMDLKNSPFTMAQLAVLLNHAGSPVFTDSVQPPALRKKSNPLADAFFKIDNTWYVLGAKETNGTLTIVRRTVRLSAGDEAPKKDPTTGNYTNVTITDVGSTLSVSDLQRASLLSGDKSKNLVAIVDEAVRAMVTACDYIVDAVSAEPAHIDVLMEGDLALHLFALDDSPYLLSLLTSGVEESVMRDTVLATCSDEEQRNNLVEKWSKALSASTRREKLAAMQEIITFFRMNPKAFAELQKQAAIAVLAKDKALPDTELNIKERANNPDAFKKLPADAKHAFAVVFWGQMLGHFLELAEAKVPPEDIVKKLNVMIGHERDLFNGVAVSDFSVIASSKIPEEILVALKGRIEGANNALTDSATAPFSTQRAEVIRAINCYKKGMFCADYRGNLRAANISLLASDLIPKPEAPLFGVTERSIVEAIVCMEIAERLFDEKDPAKASSVFEAVLAEKRKLFGDKLLDGFTLGTGLDTAGMLAALSAHINSLLPRTEAHSSVSFSSQLSALDRARLRFDKDPRKKPEAADMEAMQLYPVQIELARRHFMQEDLACGWQESVQIEGTGEQLFIAGASGHADVMSLGLMHYMQTKHRRDIELTTQDGKTVFWAPCAPPPKGDRELSGKAYFHFVERNKKAEETPYKPSKEEARKLRAEVCRILTEHANLAMQQSAVRPDPAHPVHGVTQDNVNDFKVLVDGKPVTMSDAPTAPARLTPKSRR